MVETCFKQPVKTRRSRSCWIALMLACIALGPGWTQCLSAQDTESSTRIGHLVRVPLPLTTHNVAQVRNTIDRLLEKAPLVTRPEDRMVIVLEFDISEGKTGRGSELESCMSLARFLVSKNMSGIQTVAYLPGPKKFLGALDDGPEPTSRLNGHAVLVAVAANNMVLDPMASIGNSGVDEPVIDSLVREVYQSIASKRLTLPVPVVMSMLDPAESLYRIATPEGVVYADLAEMEKLDAANRADDIRQLSRPGESRQFSAEELVDYRLIPDTADSRPELARLYNLPAGSLLGDPTLGQDWDPVLVEMPEYIDNETVQWIIRSLQTRKPNMVILQINSGGSDPDACLRLAQHLAEYDSGQFRSVAYVTGVARGPAAMLALCCDQLIMAPSSELGGIPQPEIDRNAISDFRPMIRDLAAVRDRNWSLIMATIDDQLKITHFVETDSGQPRLLCDEEVDELGIADQLQAQGELPIQEGLDAQACELKYSIADTQAEDLDTLQNFYQLDGAPQTLKPTVADRWLKQVANTLASPMIAPWLLFGAVFFLSTEMSAPGIGVPGFLGTICLILFFWSQHLGGNAHWLEILLFVAGLVFILLELFVIPGFGIFGIGGFVMVVVSIVLASQTFVFPRTSAEVARLPYSMLPLLGAGLGFIVAVVVLRNVLPNAPYFRRMMLRPPKKDETGFGTQRDPEAIVDWSGLVGHKGETLTPLVPAGKARIGGKIYDVISDGRMVDKGTPIEVVDVAGNRIEVREA